VDYQIPCECVRKDRRVFFRGTVGMAHRGRDTGSASFFIALRPIHRYDGEYTAFGRVVKGMEVLARLQRRDPDKADAPDPDAILTATVLRKRPHPYVFRKVGEAAPESGDKKLPKLPPPAQGPEPGAGNPAKPQAAGRAESKPAAELHVPAKPQAAKSPPPAP
jgi:hypothetical protein